MTTLANRLCILTIPPSLGPLRLMLADAPLPRGSGATLANVGTLSGSTERFVASPLYPVGYVRWDGRSDQSSSQTITRAVYRSQHADLFGAGHTAFLSRAVQLGTQDLLQGALMLRRLSAASYLSQASRRSRTKSSSFRRGYARYTRSISSHWPVLRDSLGFRHQMPSSRPCLRRTS